MINEIRQPSSGSAICLIMSMIKTDRIGRHGALLPINHKFNKSCEKRLFFKSKHKKFQVFFASSEKKKPFKGAHDDTYCPIT